VQWSGVGKIAHDRGGDDYHRTILVHGTDRSRREVVEVRDGSGWDLGEQSVRSGFARWDRQEAPHADHLRRAEEEARAARRGIWAATTAATNTTIRAETHP
jgi:endonuclease YncB( thermonuclease family)